MTTNNTPWSLGSWSNISLNPVEPPVPPHTASDLNPHPNHGRSTPAPSESTEDSLNSPEPPQSLLPQLPPEIRVHSCPFVVSQDHPSFKPAAAHQLSFRFIDTAVSVNNSNNTVRFTPFPYVSPAPQSASNSLSRNAIPPESSTVPFANPAEKVQNRPESAQTPASQPHPIVPNTVPSGTFPYLPNTTQPLLPLNPLPPSIFEQNPVPSQNVQLTPSSSPAPFSTTTQASAPSAAPSTTSREPGNAELPASIRARKIRAHSFAASLTPAQRLTLIRWLADEDLTLADIQRNIAAPAPEGFGLRVNHNSVRRLRAMYHNQDLQHWLDEAMDLACDLLDPTHDADVAPLRDSLIYIIYSQAIQKSRHLFIPAQWNQCCAAIERLERMKRLASQRAHPPTPPTPPARVHLDVRLRQPQFQKPKNPKNSKRRVNITTHREADKAPNQMPSL